MGDPSHAAIRVVAAPLARAGAGDPTRRWALRHDGHPDAFPGLTPPEAEDAARALAETDAARWDVHLVEVSLPVVLSDGAGPHAIDAAGRLTLVLGIHPGVPGAHIAMGEPAPTHALGLVRPVAGRLWEWIVHREVVPGAQVEALDELATLGDLAGARRWERGGR